MSLGQFWDGRVAALRSVPIESASNVFEELSVLEGWLQMVADVQYRKIREAANEEWKGASRATVTRRHRVLHAVIFESWAAGLYQEDPAGFVVAATTLDGLAYRSLLECSSVDGIDSLPSDLPPKFRSVAKKWFRCNEQREKDSDARRDDQRAARSKDQPLTVLDVAEQIAIHGLMHLPRELTPSHTELNAFQRKVEREPDVALPYVDIHKEPYTPVTAGWITASHRPFVQTVCALQRYLVIAGLTGAFGRNPLPVVFGYPALVCDLAARFGCSLAREYDEQARRRFASERRAVPGTIILTAASERLLCLDTATVLSLNMNAGTLGVRERREHQLQILPPQAPPPIQREVRLPVSRQARALHERQPRVPTRAVGRGRNRSQPDDEPPAKRSKPGI
ncbi:hypothetical protein DIPPA_11012 [Diplonema papillatum]|nr:hypothetical protein DIPPA_15154 [Diplonema papillatum]KAJ9449091.1 hypothetical protein DIPPA_08138 [Diplonema papillatum]KAJ9464971.1 hypothetical protein DIPPA_11012 [Diplonema papillatum]